MRARWYYGWLTLSPIPMKIRHDRRHEKCTAAASERIEHCGKVWKKFERQFTSEMIQLTLPETTQGLEIPKTISTIKCVWNELSSRHTEQHATAMWSEKSFQSPRSARESFCRRCMHASVLNLTFASIFSVFLSHGVSYVRSEWWTEIIKCSYKVAWGVADK